MADRQIFQLSSQTSPATTSLLPMQIFDGSVEAEKVTLANLKIAFALVKADVGLGNVDNTADTAKPISTLTQTALNLKAPIASPTFTGTVSGITKTMVGLANVDNTSDVNKPVSTAQQTALDLKVTGPATATDNAITRFDSTTGELVQNSLVTIDDIGKITMPSTVTPGATTGDQVINQPSGTVNFAAAATAITVTNSLVSATSIVLAVVRTNDSTAVIKNVVPGAGSFVITLNAAATAETSVGFVVFN